MKRSWYGLLALVLVAGCGGPAPSNGGQAQSGTLNVMVFEGGYGKDFYVKAAAEYDKEHPGLKTTVTGDPRIDEQLKPLFIKGTPPDLTFPGWRFDHWGAVAEGQVMQLDDALAEPAYNSKTPWKDTFEPSLLKLGQSEGKTYVLPYFFSVLGWWYDPDLFKENNWTPPKTYEELLALCAKIKAKGIAPITYQGQYPDYMIAGMLEPWIISVGGMDKFDAIQNLEPGAWKDPSVVKAASMIKELKDMGYFENGASALSHTQSQTDFLVRKAAMIPCGTWLYSEMIKSMPKGRHIEFMLPPVPADGKGDPSAIMIKIEPWLVPTKAKNSKDAIGLFKYMTSLEKAEQFVTEKGTLMAIKGSDQVDLPPYLKSAATDFKSSKAVWAAQWKDWYPELYKNIGNLVTQLLNGDVTPDQFADQAEAAAEKTRQDPDVTKHKVS